MDGMTIEEARSCIQSGAILLGVKASQGRWLKPNYTLHITNGGKGRRHFSGKIYDEKGNLVKKAPVTRWNTSWFETQLVYGSVVLYNPHPNEDSFIL